MDEMKRQMDKFRQSMPELFQFNKQQMEQFRQQLKDMNLGFSQQV
jgi:hypothetical protein